jgi:NADH-quinone oxidoreductase subunit L
MLVPLALLAVGAVAAGAATPYFVGALQHEFWGHAIAAGPDNRILHELHEVPAWVSWAPTVAMAAGFVIAYLYYIAVPSLPAATAKAFRPLYLFLLNKWYFDELYDLIFVRPTFWLGNVLWKVGDIKIINGLIDGTAAGVYSVTQRAVRLQTGYIYHYAFAMLIGLALLVSYFMFMGGPR